MSSVVNKIVLRTGQSKGERVLSGTVYAPDHPQWLEMQDVVRGRVRAHPVGPDEISQMLDMLGLGS